MRYFFKLGEVFKPKDILGKWIVGLSIILNDLILANNCLIDALEKSGEGASPEGSYFFRLTCSHFREAAKYFGETKDLKEISDFLKGLDPSVQKDFDLIKSSIEPWETSFVKTKVKPIRDNFFHYPNLQNEELDDFLKIPEIQASEVSFYSESGNLRDLRLEFADEIINLISFKHLSDESELMTVMKKLQETIVAYIKFSERVITEYLGTFPETVISER